MMRCALIVVVVVCASPVAQAETFVTSLFLDRAAARLQSRLAPCASFDGLVEARRGSAEWSYAFWTEADKTSATEVRVKLAQVNAYTTEVKVDVVTLQAGLLFDSEERLSAESREWTTRISALLDTPDGVDPCVDSSRQR